VHAISVEKYATERFGRCVGILQLGLLQEKPEISEWIRTMVNLGLGSVLFVNGINTAFGGSGRGTLEVWSRSLRAFASDLRVLDAVPNFGLKKKGFALNALLALYFFPGTAFRLSSYPLFEFFYKLSPLLLLQIWRQAVQFRPDVVILSHHTMFLYSFLFERSRRHFLIHDLLCTRARSLGYSRVLCKALFKFEVTLYRNAAHLMVLSEQERRVLKRFLAIPISLIACVDKESAASLVERSHQRVEAVGAQAIAIVSDWRRPENRHGMIEFFSSSKLLPATGGLRRFVVYGLGVDQLREILGQSKFGEGYVFEFVGPYSSISEIPEDVFLVPIYQGSGIKTKVLEAFLAGRFVVGTSGAFLGLRMARIKQICSRVSTPREIRVQHVGSRRIVDCFERYYFSEYSDLGSALVASRPEIFNKNRSGHR
jgi:hypothetical protein